MSNINRRNFLKSTGAMGALGSMPFTFSGCGSDSLKESNSKIKKINLNFDLSTTGKNIIDEMHSDNNVHKELERDLLKRALSKTNTPLTDAQLDSYLSLSHNDNSHFNSSSLEISHSKRHPIILDSKTRIRASTDTSSHSVQEIEVADTHTQILRIYETNPSQHILNNFFKYDDNSPVHNYNSIEDYGLTQNDLPTELLKGTILHIPGYDNYTVDEFAVETRENVKNIYHEFAKSLIFQHSDLRQVDPAYASKVMLIIEQRVPINSIALMMYWSFHDTDNSHNTYYKLHPIMSDSTPVKLNPTDYPGASQKVMYKNHLNNKFLITVQEALKQTLNYVQNEPSLKDVVYQNEVGVSSKSEDTIQARSAKKIFYNRAVSDGNGNSFTLNHAGEEAGFELALANSSKKRTVVLKHYNKYLRFLGLYARFYDSEGNIVKNTEASFTTVTEKFDESVKNGGYFTSEETNNGISGYQSLLSGRNIKCLDIMFPPSTVAGVPTGRSSAEVELVIPDEASYVKLFAGGLGAHGNHDSEAEWLGMTLTAFINIALPLYSLSTNSKISDGGQTIKALAKDAIKDPAFLISLFAFAATAGSGKNVTNSLESLGFTAADLLFHKAMEKFLAYILTEYGITIAQEATPLVGWALHAAAVITTTAMLAQTTASVIKSPIIFERRLDIAHNIYVSIKHDTENYQFPATAEKYKLFAKFSDSDIRVSNAIYMSTTTQTSDISYTFVGVPSGGEVEITILFYSNTNWIAARGEKKVTNLNNATGRLDVNITIEENLVPLNAQTDYHFKQLLQYSDKKKYYWAGKDTITKPTETLTALNSGTSSGNLSRLGSITISQKNGAIGYAWKAFSDTVKNHITGATNQQLWMFRNISGKEDPDTGKKFSGSGFQSPTPLNYDLLGSSDRLGDNYVLTPKDDGKIYVRRVSISEGSSSFNINYNENWGIFPESIDGIVLHPARYLVGISSTYSKIYILKLPNKAIADNETNNYNKKLAKITSGKAKNNIGYSSNMNLLSRPVNIGLGDEGAIFILDDVSGLDGIPSGVKGRFRAYNVQGSPIKFFKSSNGGEKVNYKDLKTESTHITYIDIAVESMNYLYVLAYFNDGDNMDDYILDIYNPDGDWISRTTGIAAGKIAVDKWRNVYSLNYQKMIGENGVTEPTVSEWIPSTPQG